MAFGSTCRAGISPQNDPNIQALIEAGTETVTIFGKSWDMHPLEALNITLDQNLEIIYQSIRFLRNGSQRSFSMQNTFSMDSKTIPNMPSPR